MASLLTSSEVTTTSKNVSNVTPESLESDTSERATKRRKSNGSGTSSAAAEMEELSSHNAPHNATHVQRGGGSPGSLAHHKRGGAAKSISKSFEQEMQPIQSIQPSVPSALHLQYPGNSTIMTLPSKVDRHRQYTSIQIEHGSSLSLISRGIQILNEEFADIDPGKSWQKFQKIGMQPYFLAVIGNGHDNQHGREVLSILSFIMDGDVESGGVMDTDPPGARSRRIVIDYVTTPPKHQGKGYASRLLTLVNDLATRHRCNMFVLSLEDSCPYWMNKSFVLETGDICQRLNNFPDCHLLKLSSNLRDINWVVPPPSENDEEEEEEEEDEEDDGDDDDDGDDEEEEDDEDEEDTAMQQAIAASMQGSVDTGLQQAINASMNIRGSGSNIVIEENDDEDDNEDEALARAIAASLGN
jgi:hypothetical protein